MLVISNSKVYDALKWIAMVALPAFGTLYFALSKTWGLSNGNEVVGSIVAVDTFLGAVLHLSSAAYNNSDAKYDGSIDVTEDDTKKSFLLNVNSNLDDLDKKDAITLKVRKKTPIAKKVAEKKKPRTSSP